MLYKNTKTLVYSTDELINFLFIVAGVLLWDTFIILLFLLSLDYVLRIFIDVTKENVFSVEKKLNK